MIAMNLNALMRLIDELASAGGFSTVGGKPSSGRVISRAERPKPVNIVQQGGQRYTEKGDVLVPEGVGLEINWDQIRRETPEMQEYLLASGLAAGKEGFIGTQAFPLSKTRWEPEILGGAPGEGPNVYNVGLEQVPGGFHDEPLDLLEGVYSPAHHGLPSEHAKGAELFPPSVSQAERTFYSGNIDLGGTPLERFAAFKESLERLQRSDFLEALGAGEKLTKDQQKVAGRVKRIGVDDYIKEVAGTSDYSQARQIIAQRLQGGDVHQAATREMAVVNEGLSGKIFKELEAEIKRFNDVVTSDTKTGRFIKRARVLGPKATGRMQSGRDMQALVLLQPQYMKDRFPRIVALVESVNRSRGLPGAGAEELAGKSLSGNRRANALEIAARAYGGVDELEGVNEAVARSLSRSDLPGVKVDPKWLQMDKGRTAQAIETPATQELAAQIAEDARIGQGYHIESIDDLKSGRVLPTEAEAFLPEKSNTGQPIIRDADVGDNPYLYGERTEQVARDKKAREAVESLEGRDPELDDPNAAATLQRQLAEEAAVATKAEAKELYNLRDIGRGVAKGDIPEGVVGPPPTATESKAFLAAIKGQIEDPGKPRAVELDPVGNIVDPESMTYKAPVQEIEEISAAQKAFRKMSEENKLRTIIEELEKIERSTLSPTQMVERREKVLDRALDAIKLPPSEESMRAIGRRARELVQDLYRRSAERRGETSRASQGPAMAWTKQAKRDLSARGGVPKAGQKMTSLERPVIDPTGTAEVMGSPALPPPPAVKLAQPAVRMPPVAQLGKAWMPETGQRVTTKKGKKLPSGGNPLLATAGTLGTSDEVIKDFIGSIGNRRLRSTRKPWRPPPKTRLTKIRNL